MRTGLLPVKLKNCKFGKKLCLQMLRQTQFYCTVLFHCLDEYAYYNMRFGLSDTKILWINMIVYFKILYSQHI